MDTDARLIERWKPDDERPEIMTERIEWRPDAELAPLVINLEPLFKEALGE